MQRSEARSQIRAVESTGKVQPRLVVYAPIGGVVAELGAREGMTVMSGAPLFRINGLGTVWVNAEVREIEAGLVKVGEAVEAHAAALPGKVFKGKVNAILPEVNAATRTLKARVELANPGGELKPGMFATVNFTPAAGGEVLAVPSEAVIQTGKRSVVIVAQENGRFAPAEVETGVEASGKTEIRKGLEPGQKVVVSGQFLIDSEASLRGLEARLNAAAIAPQAAASQPAAPAAHRAEGKVEALDKDTVTLTHGDIPALKWPAMTMDFKLPPPAQRPPGLAAGDRVEFEFRLQENSEPQITALRKLGGKS